jgi:hypothetical protein
MAEQSRAASTSGTVPRAGRIVSQLGTSRYKEYELAGYAEVVRARVPQEIWTGVFFSWMSLKGHLQGLSSFDRSQFFAAAADGAMDATFVVVFDDAEALAEWLEAGSSAEKMLLDMGIDPDDVHVELMRDFS